MTPHLHLVLGWDVQQLLRLQQALHQHAMAHDWGERLESVINLMAEELVVNVMTHGHEGRHPDADPGWVRVELHEGEQDVTLIVSDNGVAFDPTQQAEPELDAPLETRGRGGLGVFLVRELADSLAYERRHGVNSVTVRKRRWV